MHRAIVVLVALSLGTFTYVTTETLPIGLLGLIASDLHTSESAVGLLVTGYGLVVVVSTIPLTRLALRWPRRPVLLLLLGMLTVTTVASALSPGYPALLLTRLLTALSQAVFWAVVTPTAAALFAPAKRGRAISLLYAGSSLAGVLGVPAGTWLGQQAGWRTAFLAIAALSLVLLLTVVVALPRHQASSQDEAARATAPDAGRYRALVVATALVVTGAFVAFTYVSPFLTQVSGYSGEALGPLLMVRGVAGLVGVAVVGVVVDRGPWLTMVAAVGLQVIALAGQFVFGASAAGAAVTVGSAGLALAALATALGARILQVAPRGTDLASAGTSTAFNVGITAGALVGSGLIPTLGLRSTALAGAVLSLAGLAVLLAEPALATARPRVGHPTAAGPRTAVTR